MEQRRKYSGFILPGSHFFCGVGAAELVPLCWLRVSPKAWKRKVGCEPRSFGSYISFDNKVKRVEFLGASKRRGPKMRGAVTRC